MASRAPDAMRLVKHPRIMQAENLVPAAPMELQLRTADYGPVHAVFYGL